MINCQLGSPPSALPEDSVDHVDGNPIDLGDLGDRQPVIHPGSDARVLRPRDLTRGPGLGLTGAAISFSRTGAGDKIGSTRGFRAGRSADGTPSETDGSAGCRFGVKSASAA